jgi:hypothetical protein
MERASKQHPFSRRIPGQERLAGDGPHDPETPRGATSPSMISRGAEFRGRMDDSNPRVLRGRRPTNDSKQAGVRPRSGKNEVAKDEATSGLKRVGRSGGRRPSTGRAGDAARPRDRRVEGSGLAGNFRKPARRNRRRAAVPPSRGRRRIREDGRDVDGGKPWPAFAAASRYGPVPVPISGRAPGRAAPAPRGSTHPRSEVAELTWPVVSLDLRDVSVVGATWRNSSHSQAGRAPRSPRPLPHLCLRAVPARR